MKTLNYTEIFEDIKNEMLNNSIRCRIKCDAKYEETETQLGYGSVMIDQQIKITGIRLMKSKNHPGEFFLSMPGKRNGQGEYFSVCSISPEWYKAIFVSMFLDIIMQKQPLSNRITDVVIKMRENGKLKAFADVTVEGITIYNIRLIDLGNRYICVFPQARTSNGYRDLVYPLQGELRSEITKAVVTAYEEITNAGE